MPRRELKLGVVAGAIAMALLTGVGADAAAERAIARTDRFPRTAGGRLVAIPGHRGALLRPTSRTARETFTTVFASGRLQTSEGVYGISVQAVHVDDPGFPGTEIFVSFGRGFGSARGKRERFAVQDHTYDSSAPSKAFTWSDNLSAATVDTGDALGRWGRIDLRFVPTTARRSTCGGDTTSRSGTLEGRFVFTPRHDNGFFGTVARATFRHARLLTSTCRHRFPTGDGACPTQQTMVDAEIGPTTHSFESFFASTTTDGAAFADALQQQWYGSMSVMHEIFAWDDSTRLRDRRGSVVINVRSHRVGLVGTATAVPTGHTYTSDPFPCGNGKQVAFELTEASLMPGPGRPLTAAFDTGAVTLPAEGASGAITREIITST